MNATNSALDLSTLKNRKAALEARAEELKQKKLSVIQKALQPPPPKVIPKPAPPKMVKCKDEECQLEGGLFVPAKASYKICPACARRRQEIAKAKREEERKAKEELRKLEKDLEKQEQLLQDFEAGNGKALLCVTPGCETIEAPGKGYNPDWEFHCFKCREEFRQKRHLMPKAAPWSTPAQQAAPPIKPKKELSETQARKDLKASAAEAYIAGNPLPAGVTMHHQVDRQIILKFVGENGEKDFFHKFFLPIGDEEKRANKAASNKRRLENRQRIADEPKGSKKDAKNKGKRK